MSYTATIGLEIHAELKTRTKMFCDSPNDPHAAAPNTNICPVCMGHPGTLPVINKEAVRQVLRVGTALQGTLADFSEFDRKNYFYPDLPKGYQLSQYQYPLVSGGTLAGVQVTRVHLEEDTARSQHEGENSLVDYNRAGVPLMELVTEPVIHDADTAEKFAEELQLLLRTLGASDANMEKGEMRVEANISISSDPKKLGTKVEVKNINSFRAVGKAITFEVARQAQVLDAGDKVVQETRGWDETTGTTFSQRLKEDSHDYRYFPDPDLPKLRVSSIPEFSRDAITASLPELPWEKRDRFTKLGFLKTEDIEQLAHDPQLEELFLATIKDLAPQDQRFMGNIILNDVAGKREKNHDWDLPSIEFIKEIATHYVSGSMSSTQAKASILSGSVILKADSSALPGIVEGVIANNLPVVEEFKKGKLEALKYLVGQGMKASKGSANPQELEKMIKETIEA